MAIIDVFDTRGLAQLGLVQSCFEAPVIAVSQFPVDSQAQAFFETQLADVGHVHLLAQRLGHAAEPEILECVEGGMAEHDDAPSSAW